MTVSMLDVIQRTPEKLKLIIDTRKEVFADLIELIQENDFEQIIFVGSGSSYSTCLSSMLFVEKASGIETITMFPNLFLSKNVYKKNTLYVFVSQTGTSTLTNKAACKTNDLGCETVAVTADLQSPLAKNCKHKVLINMGYEEYSYATLGFSCSMLVEMLMGIEIGLARNYLDEIKYNAYIEEAYKVPQSNSNTCKSSLEFYNAQKERLLKAENFIFYGGTSLWGIGNEGALKVMEITKKYVSIGYEMDDGMHGPNYCLDERTIVFALNDGKDDKNANDIMKLMKNEYKAGYMVGINPMDNSDLKLDLCTENFTNIEIIPFVQVLAYKLAVDNNVDIFPKSDPRLNTTKGKGYFNMHGVQ